jgi:hypothetical protein
MKTSEPLRVLIANRLHSYRVGLTGCPGPRALKVHPVFPFVENDGQDRVARTNNNLGSLSSENEMKNSMTKLNILKGLGLALGCAALLLSGHCISAAEVRANAGTTFLLTPTADPNVLTHTVDGVAQVSPLGNCTVHADVEVRLPTGPGQPIALKGILTITTADGATSLKGAVEGAATPDPANSSFLNFHYQVAFTGGSGQFAAARGDAKIEGVALFTSLSAGKATWKMKGQVEGNDPGQK